jgi:hypothetical protein
MIKSMRMRWTGHIARIGRREGRERKEEKETEKNNAYRIFVGKTAGNVSLEIPRCRWMDNIKMALR